MFYTKSIISPKIALSRLVGSLKGVSSRYVREANYPEIKKVMGQVPYGHPAILLVVVVEHR